MRLLRGFCAKQDPIGKYYDVELGSAVEFWDSFLPTVCRLRHEVEA